MVVPLPLLREAYLTGWIVAAPIGPVNLEIIRRSLRRSVWHGWMIGLGATCVDAFYLVLFSAGLGAALTGAPGLRRILFALGGGLLMWLGAGALREAWAYRRRGEAEPGRLSSPAPPRFADSLPAHFLIGVAMCASNPMTLAFWSSLSLRFVDLTLPHRLAASAMVWLGALSWTIALSLTLAFARRWIGPRLFALVTALGGACLVYFGADLIHRVLR